MNQLRKRRSHFTVVSNQALLDTSISLKAKGLLVLLLSRPDGWKYRLSWIVEHSLEGIDAVRAGLKELEAHGYLKRVAVQEPTTGRMQGYDWYITDTANEFSEEAEPRESRDPEEPDSGLSGVGIFRSPDVAYAINNTELTNTDLINTDKDIKKEARSFFSSEPENDSTTEPTAPLSASALATPETRSTLERGPSANTPPNPPSRRRAQAGYDPTRDERLPDWFTRDVWRDFCEHRRNIKHPLTPLAVSHILSDFDKWLTHHTQAAIVEAVRLSIKSGWRGVFEPKTNGKHPPGQARTKPVPLRPGVEMKYDVENLDYNDPEQVQWYMENFVTMEGTWGRK